jgi:hypothetical protein
MILRFFYEGNTPSKKNQKRIVRRKNGTPFITDSSEHRKWHNAAVVLMGLQRSRHTSVRFPIPRCSQVLALLYYQDHRRRDSSNTFESIMDLLVDAGVLADDCWAITGPTAQFPQLRKDRPGWEVQLHVADHAPGITEVHNQVMPAKESWGRMCECGHRESEHEFQTGFCGIDFEHCAYFRPAQAGP